MLFPTYRAYKMMSTTEFCSVITVHRLILTASLVCTALLMLQIQPIRVAWQLQLTNIVQVSCIYSYKNFPVTDNRFCNPPTRDNFIVALTFYFLKTKCFCGKDLSDARVSITHRRQ